MTRTTSIANRLREVLLHGKWIANTNCKEQLLSINREQATQQIGNLNTIALLTYHLNYYLAGLLPVFNGGTLDIHDKYSFDLPPILTDNDWQQLVNDFLYNAEQLAQQVEQMEDHQLDQPFVEERYGTYERNIEGVIEHCYYHLGQITLLKKMITGS
jgi:DinB superfamily